ncbi:hypothetical protein LZ30DRAFT_687297 [Colletotrichum cereale]|nr:hypothetical protein LZ30DRAFT_687297 [Colletotrichum cereale]
MLYGTLFGFLFMLLAVETACAAYDPLLPYDPENPQFIIVGYRTVPESTAKLYKDAGDKLNRVCVIIANREAFDKVKKIWIPAKFWYNMVLIGQWVELGLYKLKMGKTVLMSNYLAPDRTPIQQLLIPDKLVEEKKLDFRAYCAPRVQDLPVTHSVELDYYLWPEVYGEPQPATKHRPKASRS